MEETYGRVKKKSPTKKKHIDYLKKDKNVPFEAFFVRGVNKTEKRSICAKRLLNFVKEASKQGRKGSIVFDIDDTLIDGNESVRNGFEDLKKVFDLCSVLFPIHIITARPDSEHANVMRMLNKKGFCIPTDRLHMLDSNDYEKGDEDLVVNFKHSKCEEVRKQHGGVVARVGDKLWDCSLKVSLTTYLKHVTDKDCYIFEDPEQSGTLSIKLPGA
jgi:hypothetical protein